MSEPSAKDLEQDKELAEIRTTLRIMEAKTGQINGKTIISMGSIMGLVISLAGGGFAFYITAKIDEAIVAQSLVTSSAFASKTAVSRLEGQIENAAEVASAAALREVAQVGTDLSRVERLVETSLSDLENKSTNDIGRVERLVDASKSNMQIEVEKLERDVDALKTAAAEILDSDDIQAQNAALVLRIDNVEKAAHDQDEALEQQVHRRLDREIVTPFNARINSLEATKGRRIDDVQEDLEALRHKVEGHINNPPSSHRSSGVNH